LGWVIVWACTCADIVGWFEVRVTITGRWTNCLEKNPAQLWRWYMQLTQAEDAFRISKSDLSLRPVFHQKSERVEAHILVCFLSLALWRTLEM
jgi:transposase